MNDTPDAHLQMASLAVAILLLDPDLTIRDANPAAEQMLGMSKRRMEGRKLSELVSFVEQRLNEWLRQGDTQLAAHAVEMKIDHMPPISVDMTLAPVNDNPGWQVVSLHETVAGETHEDNFEKAVRTPAILAHEIKNPLAAIRGAAQLLGRTIGGKDLSLTTLIADEVDRIAKLIDRMQSLGREQPEPVSACNLHQVIRRARTVIETAGDDKGILLVEEFDPSLPHVLGNADGLVQVLINLISNACDACKEQPEPRVTLRTRFVSGFVMNAIRLGRPIRLPIELRVSDNGTGVDPALRDHIFEPFVSSKKRGQGLGLALVKKLVRDMDGRISHERDEAEGLTHFSIHLPMAKVQGSKRAA